MDQTLKYYQEHLGIYKAQAQKLHKKMTALSLYRLIVFVAVVFGVYYLFNEWQVALIVVVVGVSLFLYLLSKYNDVKAQKQFHEALVKINEAEIKIASGDFHDRKDGSKFQDPNHFYSLDIDLFGRGSFFQFINRTTINEGTHKLADALKANNIEGIIQRQEAIRELNEKVQWRQYYSATSSLISIETPAKRIIDWVQHYQPFLPKYAKGLPLGFSIVSILIFGLIAFNIITMQAIIGYWLLVGLGVSSIYLKKINALSSNTDKMKDTFRQYALLLDLIEKESFTSPLLQKKQKQIQQEGKKASQIFKELSKALDALDNRNNFLWAIFGNGFFLADIKNSHHIETWIKAYADKVEDWFEVVSFFDAYNSLGNFAFNHPDFVYPEIEDSSVIKAEQLGHPLLKKEKRVDSNVTINKEQFFIVTGANMAGKSTFLRTVSLHIVMANVGLPVCATSSSYSPVKLITSMRTTDSLTDDSSYFFSELKRLKYIVEAIQTEPYFIVLDEILKGTNSTDKAIGSKKFVEKLVASHATGIIATHDLSLCEIEKELDEVKNYYFDAEIVNDELYFDYKLKEGICKNMNASFLLKKMNIV